MKTIKLLIIILTFFSFILLNNFCTKDESEVNLDTTIFIEDQYNAGLPKYSEKGYNSFGVYIGREPFVSNQKDIPLTISVKDENMIFRFKGTYQNNPKVLEFTFNGFSPKSYVDLDFLNGKEFNLAKPNVTIKTSLFGSDEQTITIRNGTFIINKVQKLYVDKEYQKTILSGEFQFQLIIENEPTAIHKGRFDICVGYENFFLL